MIYPIAGKQSSRLVVVAYDIHCQRRARRVRRVLDPFRHAKQYSVYELRVSHGEFRGILAEISMCCDFSSDLLANWWPLKEQRLYWREDHLAVDGCNGGSCSKATSLASNLCNFIVCYDMTDPDLLRAVAGEVAPEAAMIQRSVYWLRGGTTRLSALFGRCAPYLTENDRLWAYPLYGSHALWRVGCPNNSILPIATYGWRSR